MTTFSQLVDSIVTEVRRPDMRNEISTYLNQTIRELHFTPDKGNAIFYDENLREDQFTAILDQGQGWQIPDPTNFQAMLDVRYDSVWNLGKAVHPPLMIPGRALSGKTHFYYRVGGGYFFSGYGGLNAVISLAYYEYPKGLKYYAAGARPAEFDVDLGWTYAPEFDVDDAHRAAAQAYVSNWILDRWDTVVSEGLRAKVYKRVSDTDRARLCYSQYTTLRQGLYTSEVSQLGSFG